jgi:Serine carboxypeptidase
MDQVSVFQFFFLLFFILKKPIISFRMLMQCLTQKILNRFFITCSGGPGCSGLLGFGTEHGPFRIDGDGNLTMNPYSWNRIANMLYIEQPAGVGFSYFETNGDKYTGDDQSAKDNYYFILNFLQRFPERQKNPFYISSESYGGHYMPQLAMYILKNDFYHSLINFKGFMVGNPYVDPYTNTITQIRAYYNHGLIAKPLFDKWIVNCENPITWDNDDCYEIQQDMFDAFGPGINPYALDYPVCFENPFLEGETYEFDLHPNITNSTDIRQSSSSSLSTSTYRLARTNQVARIDEHRRQNRMNRNKNQDMNQHQRRLYKHGNRRRHHHHPGARRRSYDGRSYDDDDFAVDDDYLSVDFDDELFHHFENTNDPSSTKNVPRTYSAQVDEFLYRNNVTNIVAPSFLPQADNTYKPCSQVHLERFLNKHDVRAALHVKDEGGFLWSACTDDIVYSNYDFDKSVINDYKEIIKMAIARSPNGVWINDLNILIFSGDDDSIASTAGTQTWIWDLGIPPVSHDEWKPWIVDGQTAGFVVHFIHHSFLLLYMERDMKYQRIVPMKRWNYLQDT